MRKWHPSSFGERQSQVRVLSSRLMDKEVMRAYHRAWYAKQSVERKKRKNELQLKRRHEIRAWFLQLKQTFSCSRCPENHVACLDFHHNDPSEKDMALGDAVKMGWSKERILKELEKCIVLCSNCHRKLHDEESGSGLIGKPPALEAGHHASSTLASQTD